VFVGGGDKPEELLGAGVVQGREADLVDEHEVVAQERLDDSPDGVVGQASVEVSTSSAAVRYLTRWPAMTAACPRAMRVWDLPVPAGPISARFSLARIHSRVLR